MKLKTILLLLLLLLLGCHRQEVTPSTRGTLTVTTAVRLLHPRASTLCQAAGLSDDQDWTFEWSTTSGTLIGKGDRRVFTADTTLGYADITCKAQAEDGTVFQQSTRILVYRQLVIVKADDFQNKDATGLSKNWLTFVDLVDRDGIKAALGIIGNSLKNGTEEYRQQARKIAANPRIEIFSHGYDHCQLSDSTYEFHGTSVSYQYKHLQKTQALAAEYLGVKIQAFGAPFNEWDENTVAALRQIPNLHLWFYGENGANKLVLPRSFDVEEPVTVVNWQRFQDHYSPKSELMVLQIHPNSWTERSFYAFQEVVDCLQAHQATFILPSEYWELETNKSNL